MCSRSSLCQVGLCTTVLHASSAIYCCLGTTFFLVTTSVQMVFDLKIALKKRIPLFILPMSLDVPSSKLTWQWKIPIFSREYIFKTSMFHCHVSLPKGKHCLICSFQRQPGISTSKCPMKQCSIISPSSGAPFGTASQPPSLATSARCFFRP